MVGNRTCIRIPVPLWSSDYEKYQINHYKAHRGEFTSEDKFVLQIGDTTYHGCVVLDFLHTVIGADVYIGFDRCECIHIPRKLFVEADQDQK